MEQIIYTLPNISWYDAIQIYNSYLVQFALYMS